MPRAPRRVSPATLRAPADSALPFYPPGVFDPSGAAEYVGFSPTTLETKRSCGGEQAFSKLGARVVFRREDLDA